MNESTKPEPLPAKPRWHYDSYFVAQIQRQQDSINTVNMNPEDANQAEPNTSCQQLALQRNEVIKRIMELADSIGVSARIIDQC